MKLNFTVDAPNSLIYYVTSGWQLVPLTDPSVDQYQNSTGVMTNIINATATFIFKGTGVWIYGAKRKNHGNYSVNLDGDVNAYSGYSPVDTFQNVLFGQSNLAPGLHALSVINLRGGPSDGYFDIDYIVWEATVADNSTSLLVDDSSWFGSDGSVLMFEYLPSQSLWNIGAFDKGSYHDTISSTNTNHARTSIIVPSTADAIAVYGKVGPSHGRYACGINKTLVIPMLQTMNGDAGLFSDEAKQQLLCYFLGLGDDSSPTLLTIANNVNSATLSIDYVEVWGSSLNSSTPFFASTTTTWISSSPTQLRSSNWTPTNVGPIVGGTIGGVVAIAVALIVAFIFYRRRQRERDITPHRQDVTETTLATTRPVFHATSYTAPYYSSTLRDPTNLTNPRTRPSDEYVSSSALVRPSSRTSMPLSEWTAPASQTIGSPPPFDGRGAIIPRNDLGYDPSPLLDLENDFRNANGYRGRA
ncbi:uncharacterized protein EI90DRAFT_3129518 [Cantharellus anzutake]|uniref:uncharacterized protein n=1 Tax=Cantharellus anzutake TaxID=1750568 RepID=UPI001904E1EF|nr:uncharacterized protein EI90DRAFT_3129518 [Cantharellus anzutake]KAF8324768.1 hypothetical protein EI90DRAFT_3129518 [Cantharellus anzutake]